MDEASVIAKDAKVAVPAGRRSFLMAMFAVSAAVVGGLLAVPLFRFAVFPLRKTEAAGDWSDVGPVSDFASLTAPIVKTITLERRDAWQTTSSQTAVYVKVICSGSFIRSIHAYGSSGIIILLCLHIGQTVLYGSYKGRRELLWLSGCILMALMLGMAFTGYLLPWDE